MALTIVPWWGKIAAKIVLSRLPLGYRVWQRVGLFRHGSMDNSAYALHVFQWHVDNADFRGRLEGKVVLELGPGDSVATALVAAAHGARAILVDVGNFASTDLEGYRNLEKHLRAAGLNCPDLSACSRMADLLETCGAKYQTRGLTSLREIADGAVDLIFSEAVLEHVPKRQFQEIMLECRRILKPGGIFSSQVDLQDHLGGALNNLRFSEALWESPLFSRSGFYTNRIRYSEMLTRFRQAGFSVERTKPSSWHELPTPRRKLAPEFRSLPDHELRVSGFTVVLR